MGNVLTPEARLSYPHLFKNRLNKLNNKLEYSAVLLFKKGEDLSKLKAQVETACEEKWGPDRNKWPKNLKMPFRDQADRAQKNDAGQLIMPEGYEAGAVYLNVRNERKPGVVDANVQPIIDENEVYGGCYVRASLACYAYEWGNNIGVNFSLQNVQKLRDGEPFSARMKPEDEFQPVAPVEPGGQASSNSIFR